MMVSDKTRSAGFCPSSPWRADPRGLPRGRRAKARRRGQTLPECFVCSTEAFPVSLDAWGREREVLEEAPLPFEIGEEVRG